MTISRGVAVLLSAIAAGSMLVYGPAFAAGDTEAAQPAAQTEARKPDVVLNKGGDAKGEAAEAAPAEAAAAENSQEGAAEPVVENEGDGARPRKSDTDGANLAGMRGDHRGDATPQSSQPAAPQANDKTAESDAEDAAMNEAAKITKLEEEKAAAKVKAEPTLFINVDLSKQRMTVSEGNSVKYTWPVSSGKYGYATPTGTFNPVWMTKMWHSRQYDGAPMPHSIFFSGGAAIHATNYTYQLGQPASHGCVRLSPRNAETLYKLVSKHGKAQTQIVVHGTPNYQVAERRRRDGYDRYAYRYEYGDPSRYYREAPEWSYKRRYSTYYGTPPRYRYDREYRSYGYRPRGVFSSNGGSYGYYGYGY